MSVTVSSYKNFVGGEWVDSTSGETMEVINPSTGETIAEVPRATAEDVDRAVQAAKKVLPEWFETTPAERAAGNAQVVKPSEQTPLTTLRFVQLAQEAEILPAGILNVITGDGVPAGEAIVKPPDVGADLTHGRRRDREDHRANGRGHAQA